MADRSGAPRHQAAARLRAMTTMAPKKGLEASSSLDPPSSDPLAPTLEAFAQDPLGFVLFAWPWGEAGTELANAGGPEPWQHGVLELIG
jgi:hypothetical protein